MKIISIFIVILFSGIAFGQNTQKAKATKIIFEREDGSIYEKMKGTQNWVEQVPTNKPNKFIDDHLVDEHRSILLTKANGKKLRSYDLKTWYPVEISTDMDEVEYSKSLNKLHNFKLFPNPAKSTSNISFSLEQANRLTISLFTTGGVEISKLYQKLTQVGEFSLDFDVTDYYSGVYILQIIYGNEIYTDKIIIE